MSVLQALRLRSIIDAMRIKQHGIHVLNAA